MRKINFEQGSPEWIAWRKGLLTATDAPMLMGVSPYVTPFKGWQRKIGQLEEQKETEPMRRGKRDEPIAREWFIKEIGIEMEPACIESDTYNFLGASLDGLSKCGRYLLEIKSNGDQYHLGLDKGIPDFHFMQMQHQLLCTDNTADMCFYLSYNKGDKIVKEVYPDRKWFENYLENAREFWKRVVFFEPPELTKGDYKDMSGESTWHSYANEYRKACEQIKILEQLKESYKKEIVNLCGKDNCLGNGIKAFKKTVRGRVDYECIPELQGVPLDKYRKPSTSTWAILIE